MILGAPAIAARGRFTLALAGGDEGTMLDPAELRRLREQAEARRAGTPTGTTPSEPPLG